LKMTDPSVVHHEPSSLQEQIPTLGWVLSVLVLADLALLAAGLVVPVVRFSQMAGYSRESYSVLGSVKALFESGDHFLSFVIFFFSAVFPILKLIAVLILWHRRLERARRIHILGRLRLLSKWSMVDVFVTVVIIGTIRMGFLANARLQLGIYLFAGAVLFSLLLIFTTAHQAQAFVDHAPVREEPGLLSAILALAGILFFVLGTLLPLMEVEKWIFWKKEYSIASACLQMADEGEILLAVLFFILVVLLPLLKLLGLFILGFMARAGWRYWKIESLLLQLDDWGMADVFALGLAVASIKIGGLADIEPRIGLWFFAAAVLLSVASSWRMRRKGGK
jgi:paraquat-inducible protein A